MASRVVVLQDWLLSHLRYTSTVISQNLTMVKLNRVFFPRWLYYKPVPLSVGSLDSR